jgi:valyl-tRNA synthetase
MAAMESQGRDIKMDEKRLEGYRNFATKLWNAARFCQANGIAASKHLEAPTAELAVNRWIIAETIATVQALDLALADLRFDEAANSIYQFVWSRFCDWYLELIKPVIQGPTPVRPEPVEGPSFPSGGGAGESAALRQAQGERVEDAVANETRKVAGWVLDQILVMLHPFMPFITEELWSKTGVREHELIVAKWPMADARAIDPAAAQEIDWLIRLVSEIRAARTELNVPPGAKLPFAVQDASDETVARLSRNATALSRLARVEQATAIEGEAQIVVDEATYTLALGGAIDLEAERARLAKAIGAAEKERDGLAGRLNNPSFVERAKPEAVEKARADHAEKAAEAERLSAALARLG